MLYFLINSYEKKDLTYGGTMLVHLQSINCFMYRSKTYFPLMKCKSAVSIPLALSRSFLKIKRLLEKAFCCLLAKSSKKLLPACSMHELLIQTDITNLKQYFSRKDQFWKIAFKDFTGKARLHYEFELNQLISIFSVFLTFENRNVNRLK